MPAFDDGYDGYYAERLWQLLPGVYRTTDTDSLGAPGPLRELVNRIGAQVAVVRRSIDRMWENQSVETCDGWVIPYLGDLLGTNLVNQLDVRAQRLDVAKTIHYRRRKGTLQVLEELAADVTGWPAHVVEGFRRLARTRHGLDPTVGPAAFAPAGPAEVAPLLGAEGLTGLLTGGMSGGFADLRSWHGSTLADGPFDESFHSADLRRPLGAAGHFGLPTLLAFLWRLTSFVVVAGTPVAIAGCADQYVFDPTGRQVPLFLPPSPAVDEFAETWEPRREWQVPGPLTASLEAALNPDAASDPPAPPYPDADLPARYRVGGAEVASIWPELGRFAVAAPPSDALSVDYHYGFSSTVGAGPYDRNLLGDPPSPLGAETVVTGGSGLDAALSAAPASATVTVGDSLTYTALADVGSAATPIVRLLVRAGPGTRPVLRPAQPPPAVAAPWVFTGGLTHDSGANLVLDGLTLSGCDLVLRGVFDTVRLTACTVDPGTAGFGDPPLATAVDGVSLAPSRIFIEPDPAAPPGEGTGIRQLVVDHCILGPVRTRLGGSVETVTVSDSILQGLPAGAGPSYAVADVFDPALLVQGLLAGRALSGSETPPYPLSATLLAAMPAAVTSALEGFASASPATQATAWGSGSSDDPSAAVLGGLNELVTGPSLYRADLFSGVALSPATQALADDPPLEAAQLAAFNRGLLDAAFPVALGTAALAVADAGVELSRVTVLGRLAAHRLWASDSILSELTAVDDVQVGHVRFSACAEGSVVPGQYESATIAPGTALFGSVSFGRPGYAQLLETADQSVVGGPAAASIATGAETGSEMGAFSADLNPLKEQGLLAKFAEYMPLGLTPVIIHVT
jgi:hypothetical protein